jgi:hypothetical protein
VGLAQQELGVAGHDFAASFTTLRLASGAVTLGLLARLGSERPRTLE